MKSSYKNNRNAGAGAEPKHKDQVAISLPEGGNKPVSPDKNEARKNRRELEAISIPADLLEPEVRSLATARLLSPDAHKMLANDDPMSRSEAAEINARRRVQHTDLMAGPDERDDLLSESQQPIRIGSTAYVDTEKSLAELMVAERGARKVKNAFRRAYLEQCALLDELEKQRAEKKMVAAILRHNVPKYLLDFARLMESLGFNRNDLRYVNGRAVRAIRQALYGSEDSLFDGEAEAAMFQRWLNETPPESEFHRISRIISIALKDGDMVAARKGFAALEIHVATLGEKFESTDTTKACNEDLNDNKQYRTSVESEVGSSNSIADSKPASIPASPYVDNSTSNSLPPPASLAVSDTKPAETVVPLPIPFGPYRYLTGWGVKMPNDKYFGRVIGNGRLAGGDGFGGVVSMAAYTPEVIPMWERNDRPRLKRDRLKLDDWYRFEVPAGNYALVHMPRKLRDYVPVTEKMFPPFTEIEQYGVAAGFSAADMRSLKLASSGRGGMDVAIRAIRAVLIMNYGSDDEDLVRFWAFLLLGRQFMSRIDVLFPNGYFHGVYAPDPAANDVGTGFFRLVRILDDHNLSEQLRPVMFVHSKKY